MSLNTKSAMMQLDRAWPRISSPRALRGITASPSRRQLTSLAGKPAQTGERSPEPAKAKAPLSVLPNTVLLRSWLLAAISSKPYLLRASLACLSWLTTTSGGIIFNVNKNPVLHFVLKNTFYKQFCAGETASEARSTLRQMKDFGFRGTILTYAKETSFDQATNKVHRQGAAIETNRGECEYIGPWAEGTLETVDLLGDGDQLALKLTGAGPLVCDALTAGQLPPKAMMDVLHEICRRARSKNARIIIDAESQHYQKGICLVGMELAHIYNRDGCARIYNTYQAYLKSTAATLDSHLKQAAEEGFTLGLKLVRGAYMSSDKRSLIHDTKQDTDNAYNAISQGALKCEIGRIGAPGGLPFPSVDLFLASHNRESLVAAHKTHQSRVQLGLPTVQLDFAQLHGMSDDLSFDLVQMGARGDHAPGVYKCSTWGTLGQCLAYLMRRAAENRDAVSRSSDEYRALKKEVRGRLGFRR
ncbi:hypothetical protein BN1723_011737 [Verticillium longisporum]|uniref:Proline dehydrogenase n=2 Tax=Verticillium longisporum TaxID=100787 RepID=A0A0G4LAP5_VERLO|nr:proline dehydrogenase like protein [Verticillium longisporum]KAG7132474.1 proline dehydrogenase like protein [Verticillium longisporum]CRK18999.1 hypothetical protein BN1723_011737 [Verticillium longisporum]CRK22274.1 hypothetical protein BN1708_013372 [Verticillium longisporum]